LTTGTLSTVSSAAPTTNVTKGSLTVGARRPISVAATATGTLTDLRVGAVFDANDPFGFTSSGTLNMGGTIDVSENATATQVAAIVVGAIWQTDVAATSPTAIVSGAHPYTLNGICTTSANNVTGNDDAEAVFLPYGAADSATFYLPEAVPNEVDHEPGEHASGVTRITGQRYGSRTVSLTAAQLPPHNHTMDHAHSATASRIRGANAANTNATSGTSFSFAMQTSAGGAFDTSEGGMTDSIDISVATHSGSTGSGPGTSSPIVVEPPSIASIAVGGKKIYVGAAP
jgi:microcystin-dependent protein